MPTTRNIEERVKIGTGLAAAVTGLVTVLVQLITALHQFGQNLSLPALLDERLLFF